MKPAPILLQPKPGVRRDGTRFDADFYSDAQWCRFQRGKPRKMGGYRMLQNSIGAIPRLLHVFSRSGNTYTHVGHGSGIDVFSLSNTMSATPPASRTPVAFTPGTDVTWDFDVVFDPIINNDAMIIGHAAPNLSSIDNSAEMPLYWGKVSSSTALTPMALPVFNTATTILTSTGNTTNTSAVVSGLSSTANLSKNVAVSGAGIPAGTRILSVDNASQVTLTAAATATASPTLTFTVGGVSGGVVVLHPYVLAFGSNGLVVNSTVSNPNDFWGTGSNAAYVTEQKIVAGRVARGGPGYSPSGLLWSLNALIRVYFTGGTTTFGFDTISDDVTIMSSQGIVELDGTFYWMGTDRFYAYSGSVRELPNDMNQNWVFDNINTAAAAKVFAFRVPRWGEIWWCYPRGTATECTHAAIYNYREGTWYDTQLPGSGRSCGEGPSVVRFPLMGGVDLSGAGGYRVWQHEVGTDEVDGASTYPVTSYFETCDYTFASAQQPSNNTMECVVVEPDFVQSGDMTMIVQGNSNARSPDINSQTFTFPATATGPDTEIIRVKEARRQMRFIFQSATIGGNYQMGKIFAHVAPGDERITS